MTPSLSPRSPASPDSVHFQQVTVRIELWQADESAQFGLEKYVKQVTDQHNDSELLLAARRGDVADVRQILNEINEQMLWTLSGADFHAGMVEIRASIVNKVKDLGDTVLLTAAEKGDIDMVKELLPYTTNKASR